jgi:hypothetical protein
MMAGCIWVSGRLAPSALCAFGIAIPHRKRRGLDQVGERIQRRLRLIETPAHLRLALFTGRNVRKPQQDGACRSGRRRCAAFRLKRAAGTGNANGKVDPLARHGSAPDALGQRDRIVALKPLIIAAEIRDLLRRGWQSEFTDQAGVRFHRSVGMDETRTAGRGPKQGAQVLQCTGGARRLGDAAGASQCEQYAHGEPQQPNGDYRHRRLRSHA